MIRQSVLIQFEYQEKQYSGYFSAVATSEIVQYDHWHLMIDNYYRGALHYSGHAGCWLFDSPSGKFKEFESYFEAYMVGWFG